MEYLTLPFRLDHAFLKRGDLHESITDSVGMILSTRIGRIPFYPEYGCGIWEREYSDMFSANKSEVRAGLRNAIDGLEKRLYNVSVSFTPGRHGTEALGMVVRVTGNYRDDSEEKKFEASYDLA